MHHAPTHGICGQGMPCPYKYANTPVGAKHVSPLQQKHNEIFDANIYWGQIALWM